MYVYQYILSYFFQRPLFDYSMTNCCPYLTPMKTAVIYNIFTINVNYNWRITKSLADRSSISHWESDLYQEWIIRFWFVGNSTETYHLSIFSVIQDDVMACNQFQHHWSFVRVGDSLVDFSHKKQYWSTQFIFSQPGQAIEQIVYYWTSTWYVHVM